MLTLFACPENGTPFVNGYLGVSGMAESSPSDLGTGIAYWVIAASLLVLGFVSMFSFGLALWLVALAMIVLSPIRSRPRVWFSGMALVVGFLIGYVAVTPWGCSQTATANPGTGVSEQGPTVCRSLIGIEYVGLGNFEPSRAPGAIAGASFGVLSAWIAWTRVGTRKHEAGSEVGETPRTTQSREPD